MVPRPTTIDFVLERTNFSFFMLMEKNILDISKYVPEHDDRIMVSFGDLKSISKHLEYLESLEIFDVPKKTPQYSENEILI